MLFVHFGRGHNEDYFCEIILKFGPVVQMFFKVIKLENLKNYIQFGRVIKEMSFKDISIFSSGSLFVQRS